MKTLDLFCTVIDNFGDIGVCRRLALQLHSEYGYAVRLWVDDLNAFARLEPELDPQIPVQLLKGLEVRHWTDNATVGITPGDLVIEGFGCRLPETFLQAMAKRPEDRYPDVTYRGQWKLAIGDVKVTGARRVDLDSLRRIGLLGRLRNGVARMFVPYL